MDFARPALIRDLDAATFGLQPATVAQAASLTNIRDWAFLDISEFEDPNMAALIDPVLRKFERWCGRDFALRNRARQADFSLADPLKSIILPGFAASVTGLQVLDSAGGMVHPGNRFYLSVRKDLVLAPPDAGWPPDGKLFVKFASGASAAEPLPPDIEVAIAAELRRTRDGLQAFGQQVKDYLLPYRRTR